MNRLSTAPARSGHRWRVIAAPLVMSIITWLYPASALAHGNLAIGDFYTGMLHPFLHFETLLPMLALALWSGQLREPHAWRLPLVFLGAALLGAVAGILEIDLRLGPTLIRLSMLVLGLLVAARAKLPAWVAISMVFLFGIYHGQANTYEPGAQLERPLLFIVGLGSTIALIMFHVVTRVHRYQAFWLQTGVRVLGSWIAATGLLVLAIEWAGKA